MDKLKLLLSLFLLSSSLVQAQNSGCTVYWGDASCTVWSADYSRYVTATKTITESNATQDDMALAFAPGEANTQCYAPLPKSKFTTDSSKCIQSGPKFQVNGLDSKVFHSADQQTALNLIFLSQNLSSSTILHLYMNADPLGNLGGYNWHSDELEKDLEYQIISSGSGSGQGTGGQWIRLPKVARNGFIDIDLGFILNSAITSILPTHEYISSDQLITFSKMHFRFRAVNNMFTGGWEYTPGLWLYKSQSEPQSSSSSSSTSPVSCAESGLGGKYVTTGYSSGTPTAAQSAVSYCGACGIYSLTVSGGGTAFYCSNPSSSSASSLATSKSSSQASSSVSACVASGRSGTYAGTGYSSGTPAVAQSAANYCGSCGVRSISVANAGTAFYCN